jgi:toxin ParE1/3/4
MAHEVDWAESALIDLVDAAEYIARDSPSYAATLVTRARSAANSLADLPHRGHRVREYRDANVRELIVARSYRLIYRVTLSSVTVIAFVHVARDVEDILSGPA